MKTISKYCDENLRRAFPFYKIKTSHIAATALLALASAGANAGGFMVNLQGAKQTGMGHVGTALKLDASSVFFNPGSMSFLESRYNFSGGVSGIASTAAYKSNDGSITSETNSPFGTPFNAYASIKITEKFSAGIAVYTPFGSGLAWKEDWVGRFLSQNITLRAVYYQPTVSYKIIPQLGVGVGLVFATGSVEVNRAIPAGPNGTTSLKGNTSAFGFQAGIYAEPTEKLSIGLTYRSQVTMDVQGGDATFNVPSSLKTSFPEGNKFSAKLPLPASLNLGVGYKITDKFLLSGEFNYIFYSVYDSLNFDFEKNTASLADSRNPRLYSDVYIARLGGQYNITDNFTVRAGGYFDKSPVNNEYYSPETPDADRIGVSTGFSYAFLFGKPTGTAETSGKTYGSKLSIDVAFLYVHGLERATSYKPSNFSGIYRVNVYVPTVGLSYNF
ncbi:MAG: OmpP1/FadL family transporter [Cytophagales bacterium]